MHGDLIKFICCGGDTEVVAFVEVTLIFQMVALLMLVRLAKNWRSLYEEHR